MKSTIDIWNRKSFLLTALALAGLVCLFAFHAEARDREARLESASPVATVSEEQLDMSKWRNPVDIATLTPNLTTSSSTASIRIRGVGDAANNSLSTLFLVNGQRVSGDISTIPPVDIERVEVLKSSSASAIYGTDAVAGVVNIITKVPQYEGSNSFIDPSTSPFRDNPFQTGFRSMSAANVDPVGQSVFGYYDNGGDVGSGAGAMFASAVKLRWAFGGPLCDGVDARVQWDSWPSEAAGQCLAGEMLGIQTTYDRFSGTSISPQQTGDYLATRLYGLGFDRGLAGDIASARVPDWSGWDSGSALMDRNAFDVGFNPIVLDHLLNYRPGGKHAMPVPDGNPWSFDLTFGEPNWGRDPMQAVRPNGPLFKKPDSVGREVAGALKKGFGAILGAGGFGVQTNNEDARAEDQWGLHAAGFTPLGIGGSAWDMVDGREKNVVVAVIDSGLDLAHPDRPRYLWTNADEIPGNGVDDDTNGYVDDINGWNFVAESNAIDDDFGHGTFVAGIIAANTDNGEGIAGVNPGAQLMTLKVSGSDGVARSLAINRALRYAVDNGARVINISLGRKGLSRLEQIGINYAYAMGCMVVVAAGNQSGDIAQYGPPGARRVVSVASLNIDGTRRSHSNKGLGVAVAAPGESIYSLTAKGGKRDGRMIPILAGDYHRLNGTSFAAPFVAGTASLIWARYPHLSNRQVEDLILASAADIEEPGWDAETGMGRLNARSALSMLPESAFAPRITEWIVNRDARGKIASVDVYGVIRGPVDSYAITVGSKKKSEQWAPACGPTNRLVEHGHIARLPGDLFQRGYRWYLQLAATARTANAASR